MIRHSQHRRLRTPSCLEVEPATGRRYPLLCTEPVGHNGDHIARNELGTAVRTTPEPGPRTTADVWREALQKAPAAYPRGEVLPPVGASSSAWEDAWEARPVTVSGSVDTKAAGGR